MTAASKKSSVLKSLYGFNAKRRPFDKLRAGSSLTVGKAEASWEETGKSTTRAAGVGVQAR